MLSYEVQTIKVLSKAAPSGARGLGTRDLADRVSVGLQLLACSEASVKSVAVCTELSTVESALVKQSAVGERLCRYGERRHQV